MDVPAEKTNPVNELLDTPELAQAIESEQFKHLLDHVPVAILIGRIKGLVERIVYANLAFRRLTGRDPSDVEGRSWDVLDDVRCEDDPAIGLGSAVLSFEDFAGTFRMRGESDRLVQAYANVVEDEDGEPKFRLVALADVTEHDAAQREDLQRQVRERDTLLKELQHRVKNNLALITALIRLEARQAGDLATTAHLDRLVGRIEALALLYQQLSADSQPAEIDLGAYLSQIAVAIMRSHASEAIRLNMQVDACPMSINIAMPVGLIVNEAMTNALKHAFEDRAGGTVTLACRRTDAGCDVTVEDDGVGLPPGTEWPSPGKLGTLVVQSLRENARAELRVWSEPGEGTRVTISIDDPARGRPQ